MSQLIPEISALSERRAKVLLQKVFMTDSHCRRTVSLLLGILTEDDESNDEEEAEDRDESESESEDGDRSLEQENESPPVVFSARVPLAMTSGNQLAGQKRRRVETCINCHRGYDADENESRSCRHHTGYKEVNDDEDAWCDYWEQSEGPMEARINEPDFQHGFTWTCCDQIGSAEGCTYSQHVPLDESQKKRFQPSW